MASSASSFSPIGLKNYQIDDNNFAYIEDNHFSKSDRALTGVGENGEWHKQKVYIERYLDTKTMQVKTRENYVFRSLESPVAILGGVQVEAVFDLKTNTTHISTKTITPEEYNRLMKLKSLDQTWESRRAPEEVASHSA